MRLNVCVLFFILFQDKKKYLDIIHSYMEVHGTVHGTSTVHLPSYVKNHGILSGRDLQFLLRETKVREGLTVNCFSVLVFIRRQLWKPQTDTHA